MFVYLSRHELIQNHVIGSIPPIKFIKDSSVARMVEVERRLKIADFGEDFEPVHKDLAINLEKPFVPIHSAEFKEMEKSRTSQLKEANNLASSNQEDGNLKSNIFELDHKQMMKALTKKKNKLGEHGFDMDFTSKQMNMKNLSAFLAKKQLKEMHRKHLKNYDPLKELTIEQLDQTHSLNTEDDKDEMVDGDWDYLVDEVKQEEGT